MAYQNYLLWIHKSLGFLRNSIYTDTVLLHILNYSFKTFRYSTCFSYSFKSFEVRCVAALNSFYRKRLIKMNIILLIRKKF